jgi:uncharacterized protein (TIGR03066 family)
MIRSIAAAVVFASATIAVAADAKPTAEKLVGTWSLVKSENELPPGAKASLTVNKDGTFVMKLDIGGQKLDLPGTWKLDGNKLNVVQKAPDGSEMKESMEIKSLTDDELVTVDAKGKKDEFKRETKAKA